MIFVRWRRYQRIGPSSSAAKASAGSDGGAKSGGGIFGTMNSLMGNMFGTRPNAKPATGATLKFDPNAYKQKIGLRGVAGSGANLGGKNADIFEMMNNGYDNLGTTFNP